MQELQRNDLQNKHYRIGVFCYYIMHVCTTVQLHTCTVLHLFADLFAEHLLCSLNRAFHHEASDAHSTHTHIGQFTYQRHILFTYPLSSCTLLCFKNTSVAIIKICVKEAAFPNHSTVPDDEKPRLVATISRKFIDYCKLNCHIVYVYDLPLNFCWEHHHC